MDEQQVPSPRQQDNQNSTDTDSQTPDLFYRSKSFLALEEALGGVDSKELKVLKNVIEKILDENGSENDRNVDEDDDDDKSTDLYVSSPTTTTNVANNSNIECDSVRISIDELQMSSVEDYSIHMSSPSDVENGEEFEDSDTEYDLHVSTHEDNSAQRHGHENEREHLVKLGSLKLSPVKTKTLHQQGRLNSDSESAVDVQSDRERQVLLIFFLEWFCNRSSSPYTTKVNPDSLLRTLCDRLSLRGILRIDTSDMTNIRKEYEEILMKLLVNSDTFDFESLGYTTATSIEKQLEVGINELEKKMELINVNKVNSTSAREFAMNSIAFTQIEKFSRSAIEFNSAMAILKEVQTLLRDSRYEKDFHEIEAIGKGAFGTVFKAVNKIDGQVYAIKKVSFTHMKNEHVSTSKVFHEVLREARALAKLNHPNVVRFYASWCENKTVPVNMSAFSKALLGNRNAPIFPNSGDITEESLHPREPPSINLGGFEIQSFDTVSSKPTQSKTNTFANHFEYWNESNRVNRSNTSWGFHYQQGSEFGGKSWSKPSVVEQGEVIPFGRDERKAVNNTSHLKQVHTLYIQMELCTGGTTLRDWLTDRLSHVEDLGDVSTKIFEFSAMCDIALQLCDGLSHIHENGFIHRDLKPANIFINEIPVYTVNNEKIRERLFELKIGDLGLAKFHHSGIKKNKDVIEVSEIDEVVEIADCLDEKNANHYHALVGSHVNVHSTHTTRIGTASYAAPEQIGLDGSDYAAYGVEADIFSLGVIFVEIFTPFATGMERCLCINEYRDKGTLPKGFLNGVTCPELASVVERMRNINPIDRPSLSDIKKAVETARSSYANSLSQKYSSSLNQSQDTLKENANLHRQIAELKAELKDKERTIKEQRLLIDKLQRKLAINL